MGFPKFYLTRIFLQHTCLNNIWRHRVLDRELKKGSAELLILSLVEDRPRHGYDIGQLIELRSRGALRFNVASLYPLLYRLEKRGWIRGRWVEKAGQRRRRYYRLTPAGKKMLASATRRMARVRRSNRPDHRNPVCLISRSEIRARLRASVLSPAREIEIVDELSQHLEDEYEQALSRGVVGRRSGARRARGI